MSVVVLVVLLVLIVLVALLILLVLVLVVLCVLVVLHVLVVPFLVLIGNSKKNVSWLSFSLSWLVIQKKKCVCGCLFLC